MPYFLGLLACPLYLINFFGILLVFDPILKIFWQLNRNIYLKLNEIMNYLILFNLRIVTGAKFKFAVEGRLPPPGESPLVIISNHQSMYDIPLLIWYLQEYSPKFIAKRELGKYIPSISFLLRTMGSLLINRGSGKEALGKIKEWGSQMQDLKGTAVIFPEGTRARDGVLKPFKAGGVQALLESMPEAKVLACSIRGSWELLRYNLVPVPYGVRTTITVKEINTVDKSPEEIVQAAYKFIAS